VLNLLDKAKQISMERGRPVIWTDELIDEILTELSCSSKGLYTICKSMGVDYSGFYKHLAKRDDLIHKYARAKELQMEYMADEIQQIADDGTNDTYIDDNGKVKTDYDNIQRSKLRVDTRKWLMSKLLPKKYGDKLDVTSDQKPLDSGKTIIQLPGGKEIGA
jgi:hypothetical protein